MNDLEGNKGEEGLKLCKLCLCPLEEYNNEICDDCEEEINDEYENG